MNVIKNGTNAVVHLLVNRAKRCHEVRAWKFGMRGQHSVALHDLLRGEVKAVVVKGLNLLNFLIDEASVGDGGNHVAGAGFSFGSNHGRPFPNSSDGLAQSGRTANEGNVVLVFVDVEIGVGRGQDFAFVNHVNAHGFEDSGLAVVSDSGFGHHRD